MRQGTSFAMMAVGWLVCSVSSLLSAAETNAPNIVLIITDDQGYGPLGRHGHPWLKTPHLDRLHDLSTRFTRFLVSPTCSPTRSALMTGRHSMRNGITHTILERERLTLSAVTLPQILKKVGYTTGIFGKWHLGDGDNAPETQGFEINVGGTRWGAPPTFFWPFKNNTRFRNEFRYVPGLDFGKQGDFLTDQLTDKAIEIIDQAGKNPFFLYLAHYAPHTPIECPEPLKLKYESKLKSGLLHQNPVYAGMIENLDFNVGRVLDHLKKTKQYDNTLIIFTSDNGGYLGDKNGRNGAVTSNHPLTSGKGSLYEGGIRVPLIIKPPGKKTNGRVIDQRVVTYDLHETILKLTDADHSTVESDGIDISGLISGKIEKYNERPVYFHYPHYYETTTPVSAIIHEDHKLLQYDETGETELYDLKNDPAEKKNLIKESPDQAARLEKMLNEWKRMIKAQQPSPNPGFKGKS